MSYKSRLPARPNRSFNRSTTAGRRAAFLAFIAEPTSQVQKAPECSASRSQHFYKNITMPKSCYRVFLLTSISFFLALAAESASSQNTGKTFTNSRNAANITVVYEDIQKSINSVKEDPFDRDAKQRRISEITSSRVGKEIFVPEGQDPVGNGQWLAGLVHRGSALRFSLSESFHRYGGVPAAYITDHSTCGGSRDSIGGYGVYLSGHYRFTDLKSDFGSVRIDQTDGMKFGLDIQISTAEVRPLSGNLEKYVVFGAPPSLYHERRPSTDSQGTCQWGANMRWIESRDLTMMWIERTTGRTVLSFRATR